MNIIFKNGSYMNSIDSKSKGKRSKRVYKQLIKFWKDNDDLIIAYVLENDWSGEIDETN